MPRLWLTKSSPNELLEINCDLTPIEFQIDFALKAIIPIYINNLSYPLEKSPDKISKNPITLNLRHTTANRLKHEVVSKRSMSVRQWQEIQAMLLATGRGANVHNPLHQATRWGH